MDSFDITKYIQMALRRKYWIIIPFLLVLLSGFTYLLKAEKIYEAKTLILVQPQKVPQDFVRSIVSSDIEDRLRTITQQVTSRTNLESIIKEYDLYSDPDEKRLFLEDKVNDLRNKIKIDVAASSTRGGEGGNAFSILFQGNDPRKVMQVTNALASNFISENLKIRESQALGTSSFLSDELESITRRLKEKEEQLKEYRLKYMGSLPEQLETSLNILGRLQMQLEQLSGNLRDAENRKLILQQQVNDSEMLRRSITQERTASIPSAPVSPGAESRELIELQKQLALLESRYTANHPDVIRLKQMIENLESKEALSEAEKDVSQVDQSPALTGGKDTAAADTAMDYLRKNQLQQIDLEIKNIRTEIQNVQSRIDIYQARIDETPKREQEMVSLNRDYDNLRELYDSILGRQLEAEIAVSMEKKQKGEQFRVIDPAKIPERPISPDRQKIILLTLAIGLGLGFGLAYLLEQMDTSFKIPEDLEANLGLPILVSLPIRYTELEIKRQRIKSVFKAVSLAMGFIISVVAILFIVKGVDRTINYINNMVEKVY